MDTLYLWVMGGLLLVSAAVLLLPVSPGTIELRPTDLGYLRRGTKGAVRTALAVLLTEGVIVVRSRGGVRRTDKPLLRCQDPFQRAVYNALHGSAGPQQLATRPPVRRARTTLVERLTDAGLVPGRFRMVVGQTMLIAVPVAAIVGAESGAGAAMAGAALLITLCLGLLSRRTIAGHRILRAMRIQRALLLAGLPPGASRPFAAVGAGAIGIGMGTGTGTGMGSTEDCIDDAGINLAVGFEAADFGGGGLDSGGSGSDGGGGGGN